MRNEDVRKDLFALIINLIFWQDLICYMEKRIMFQSLVLFIFERKF